MIEVIKEFTNDQWEIHLRISHTEYYQEDDTWFTLSEALELKEALDRALND